MNKIRIYIYLNIKNMSSGGQPCFGNLGGVVPFFIQHAGTVSSKNNLIIPQKI